MTTTRLYKSWFDRRIIPGGGYTRHTHTVTTEMLTLSPLHEFFFEKSTARASYLPARSLEINPGLRLVNSFSGIRLKNDHD